MTTTIRILPPALVAKIAAGEVITRPRAVVRELADNALDAGATRVEIEIEGGGYRRIAVHDDGHGIRAADAPLVLARHATSKLPADDRLDAVTTLGFRGEALASIAAVAAIELRSRHAEERVGVRVSADGGDAEVAPLVRQPGTSVTVADLFLRYPVRRGTADPAGEGRAIRKLVAQLALARPAVRWSLRVDGRTVIATSGGTLRETFAELNGVDALPYLLDAGIEHAAGSARGLLSAPVATASRANRDGIVLVVNGRLCVVSELQRAVERAYSEVLPRHRFPHAVLHVAVPPARVDPNVHPAKERVVLHDGRLLAAALDAEIRALLGRTAHLVGDKRSLALQAADLPALRAAEERPGYDSGGWGARVVEAGSLPRLRVVGHVEDTLVVCESELGTLLVDQHRAHERVIFERLRACERAPLAEPALVRLPPDLLALLDARADDLRGAGWEWEESAPGELRLLACPAGFAPDDLGPVVERFAAETAHSILAAAACHAAIRKRRPLTPAAAVELLEALTRTTTPTTCPHGQPIVLNLDHGFLARQFGWR